MKPLGLFQIRRFVSDRCSAEAVRLSYGVFVQIAKCGNSSVSVPRTLGDRTVTVRFVYYEYYEFSSVDVGSYLST